MRYISESVGQLVVYFGHNTKITIFQFNGPHMFGSVLLSKAEIWFDFEQISLRNVGHMLHGRGSQGPTPKMQIKSKPRWFFLSLLLFCKEASLGQALCVFLVGVGVRDN